MTIIDSAIYDSCLRHHIEVSKYDFVKADSLPIPYFGNVNAYQKSPIRVLTAALNPSDKEFPASAPRFDVEYGLTGAAQLEQELSRYFEVNPYRTWFRSFEPVLNGLDASYGGRMADQPQPSTAMHLDMCSPIATHPTWSKLSPQQRATLTEFGKETFELLIDELRPDIVIASLGWYHIESWHEAFRIGKKANIIVEFSTTMSGKPMRIPLVVQTQTIKSRNGHVFPFVNASAADKPFGRFSNERKGDVGRLLLELIGAR